MMDSKKKLVTRITFGIVEISCISVGIFFLIKMMNGDQDGAARIWFIIVVIIFVIAIVGLCILENFVFKDNEDDLKDIYGDHGVGA